MAKIVLFIAASLDGRIARNDGSLDWLYALANPDNIDHGYAEFLSGIGTTIMGKSTYNEIIGFGVEWPYQGINSYVVTHDKSFSVSTPNTFVLHSDIVEFVTTLREESPKDIWLIGGGQIITYFLNHTLLDRIILTIIPTIIGAGIPLFPNDPKETQWTLAKVEQFSTGVVNLTYDRL